MSSNLDSMMSVPGGDGDSSVVTSAPKQPRQNRLTEAERAILEDEYKRNNTPNRPQRDDIAAKCGRNERCVAKWFRQRRKDSATSDVASNPSPSASHGISPQMKPRRSLGFTGPEYISEEERILFRSILPVLPQLNQLYAQNPSVSVERAMHWAATLGLKNCNGIIEQWLNHRRLDDKESGKAVSTPQNLPMQPPSADTNAPYTRAATHLPTPSSASPSPRTSMLHLKEEPQSPSFGSPSPLLASPITVGNRNTSRWQSLQEHPISSSYPNSPVEFAHPSEPLHQGARHAPFSPAHQPIRVRPQDFSEFIRSQYPNRAAFDAAVQKMKVEDADGALAAFTRMGREAADAIADLNKVLQRNPS